MTTTMTRLPFVPESEDALRERYRDALTVVYDQLVIARGTVAEPSKFRKHVFDFPDGLRLIVSRERTPDGIVKLHVSSSFEAETPISNRLRQTRDRETVVGHFLAETVDAWRRISGSRTSPTYLGMSRGMVPHWYVEDP